MKTIGLVALAVLTLISFAPLICVLLAGGIASGWGCSLDEGSVHPCVIGGADWGETLYTGFVLGWLLLLTWPGILLSMAGWTWVVIARLLRRARR